MEEEKQKIENSENTETQQRKRRGAPPEYLFKPGQSGNPNGRPKGSKNFTTLFEKAVKDVAKKLELGEDPDAVEIQIIQRGIKEALSGKYPFYKDLFDRIYGKPAEVIKLDAEEGFLSEVEIKIKNETDIRGEQKHNDSIHKKSEPVAEPNTQNNNQ